MTKKFKNKKKYYNSQKNSIFKEGESFKGILVTCPNSKERFAVRDCYRFLNEIYEQKFGRNLDDQEEQNIEEHLKNNLDNEEQNQEQFQKNKKQYFAQQIKIKAKGLIFIKLDQKYLEENYLISNFVDEYIQNVQEKILPIEIACQANFANFQLFMQQLIDKFFDPKCELKKTWCLVYKCRNNNFLKEKVPSNYGQYDYKGDYHILIDITSSFMCLSILPNYNKLNRYSLVQSTNEQNIENDKVLTQDDEKDAIQEEILDKVVEEEIELIQF